MSDLVTPTKQMSDLVTPVALCFLSSMFGPPLFEIMNLGCQLICIICNMQAVEHTETHKHMQYVAQLAVHIVEEILRC